MVIELPFPPSSNTAYADNGSRGGRHLSKAAKAWQEDAKHRVGLVVCQRQPPASFALAINLWMPDKRRRDVDNYIKLPKDALCSAWGIDDDWQQIPMVTVSYRGIIRGGLCKLVIDAIVS